MVGTLPVGPVLSHPESISFLPSSCQFLPVCQSTSVQSESGPVQVQVCKCNPPTTQPSHLLPTGATLERHPPVVSAPHSCSCRRSCGPVHWLLLPAGAGGSTASLTASFAGSSSFLFTHACPLLGPPTKSLALLTTRISSYPPRLPPKPLSPLRRRSFAPLIHFTTTPTKERCPGEKGHISAQTPLSRLTPIRCWSFSHD